MLSMRVSFGDFDDRPARFRYTWGPVMTPMGNRKHGRAVMGLALFELDIKALDRMYHEVRGHL